MCAILLNKDISLNDSLVNILSSYKDVRFLKRIFNFFLKHSKLN